VYGGVEMKRNTLMVFPSVLPHHGFKASPKELSNDLGGRFLLQWLVYKKDTVFPCRVLDTDHTLTVTSLGQQLIGDLFSPYGNSFCLIYL
jgi:hypothetical protein